MVKMYVNKDLKIEMIIRQHAARNHDCMIEEDAKQFSVGLF